jgi:rhodanese-related sulfurtransferase
MFMRRVFAIVVVCMLSAAVASAQMKVQPSKPGPAKPLSVPGTRTANPATFPRISIADALRLYKSGKAVFIDVRSNEQFSYGHIRGAKSIPNSQLVQRFNEVTPGLTVITYCACSAEQSSGRGASTLIAHGVKNVFALKGGWDEWKSAGNPTAIGPK